MKNINYKYPPLHLLIIAIGFFGCLTSYGQQKRSYRQPYEIQNHRFSVSLGAETYRVMGSLPMGIENNGNHGFNLDLDYQYRFSSSRKWTFGMAVGYEQIQFQLGKESLENRKDYIDFEGETFNFRYFAKEYNEKWEVKQVNIPITIEYNGLGNTAFYFRTGIKYSIQFKNNVQIEYRDLETSGYFEQWDLLLTEPKFAGFGSFEQLNRSKELKLNNRLAWIGEVGIKQKLWYNNSLYMGIYFDIGLNDQAKGIPKSKKDLLHYNPEPGKALNLIGLTETNGAYKTTIKTYGIGLKLRYSL